jgi:uncharacterized protein (DUF885 family)
VEAVMREEPPTGVTTPRVIAERALRSSKRWRRRHDEERAVEADDAVPASIDAERARGSKRTTVVSSPSEMFPASAAWRLTCATTTGEGAHTDGFGALPGGEKMYRYAVRSSTTTDLRPRRSTSSACAK